MGLVFVFNFDLLEPCEASHDPHNISILVSGNCGVFREGGDERASYRGLGFIGFRLIGFRV